MALVDDGDDDDDDEGEEEEVKRRGRRNGEASRKKKTHVLCALCGLPEWEPQVHSKVTNTRFKRRGPRVQKDAKATNVVSARGPAPLSEERWSGSNFRTFLSGQRWSRVSAKMTRWRGCC